MSRKHRNTPCSIGSKSAKQRVVPNAFEGGILSDVVTPMMPADPVPAWVGIDNFSTGTPTLDVVIPSTNRFVTLAEIKRAAREHYFILNLLSPDMRQWLQFMVSETDIEFFYRELHNPLVGGLKG